ncbi:MAG: hypothetical protein AAF617_08930, partial [Bacteroidota bacterium]
MKTTVSTTTVLKKIAFFVTLFPVLLNANMYRYSFCGYDLDEGTRSILLLDQTLISDPSLYPFLNCTEISFCNPFGNAPAIEDDYSNLKEWERYFNGKLTTEAIVNGFYRTTFLDFDQFKKDHTLKNYVPKTELERFILASPNTKELLPYFWFAKKCELIYQGQYQLEYSWYQGESIAKSNEDFQQMYQEAIALYNSTNDAFLKNRIGFQIVRLAFELGVSEPTEHVFNTYMKYDESSKYIYYKAMERNATMLYRRGKKVESLEQFRQVFENLQDRKDDVFLSLQRLPMGELDLSQHPQEKEFLHFSYGFRGNHIAALKEILAINPNSTYAEVLAMRYFDSLHAISFGDTLLNDEGESMFTNMEQAVEIVDNQLGNVVVKNKELWFLFKGIIEIAYKDYEAATRMFTKKYTNQAYKSQADILVYATKVAQLQEFDRNAMNQLFLELKRDKNLYSNHGVRGFYFQKMSQLYANSDQTIISVFLTYQPRHYSENKVEEDNQLSSDLYPNYFFYEKYKYLKEEELLTLKALITAPTKTKLEQFIVSLLPKDPTDFVNEMLGTYY